MSERAAIDFRRLFELTFIITVIVGTPLIALSALFVELPDFETRVVYATTIAAAVWLVTAVVLYARARYESR